MLERASRKDANGAMSSSGTAHPRVVDGSNVKPALVPDAAPDALVHVEGNPGAEIEQGKQAGGVALAQDRGTGGPVHLRGESRVDGLG